MRVLYERCCGLDIHKKFVVALAVVEDLDGALETPGAEEVIDSGEGHDVASDVLCCAVFSR